MGVIFNSVLGILTAGWMDDLAETMKVMATGVIYKFILSIATVIYDVASAAFQVFLILSNGMVIKDINYETVLHNFYIVIGVVMLFILSFVLLRAMVNPDDQSKGATSIRKIIVNLVTSTIIIALLPTVFNFMFDVQTSFISNNVIGKVFNYGGDGTSVDKDVRIGSYKIVNGVFTAFFNADPDYCQESTKEGIEDCQSTIMSEDGYSYNGSEISSYDLRSTINAVDETGKFSYYKAFAKNAANDQINFNFILMLIAGCLLVYVGASYCFDMALRLVKLVFYQLIAPIPIFMRVVPDGKFSGTFNTWIKVTLTCYFEVYVRILVLYVAVWLCTNILNPENNFFNVTIYSPGFVIGNIARAFVLMGIVMFMRQAPKLVSEVTGFDSGNMKLGIRDKLAAGGAFTAGALLGGGVTAAARNAMAFARKDENKWKEASKLKKAGMFARGLASGSAISGGVSGAVRGAFAGRGAKSFADMRKAAGSGAQGAVDARVKRANYRAAHSAGEGFIDDTVRVLKGHASDTAGVITTWAGSGNVQDMRNENRAMDSITSARDAFDNNIDSFIRKEMSKGKTSVDTGKRKINFDKIFEAQRLYDEATAQGYAMINGQRYSKAEIETLYNNEVRNARYQMQDDLLVSEKNWNNLDSDVRAKLSALRVDAVNYKGSVRNNANLNALREADIIGDNFASDKDYKLTREIYEGKSAYYGGVTYTDYSYDSGNSELTYTNSNGQKVTQTLDNYNDRSLIQYLERAPQSNLRYDDNLQIDTMNKAIKRIHGENDIGIAAKAQEKPDEK